MKRKNEVVTIKSTMDVVFVGIQKGFDSVPDMELYNLTRTLGHHPADSTLSKQTLESFGYRFDNA